jgi:hypothetical protein
MIILTFFIAINCAEPRLTFREFYSVQTGIPQGPKWPAQQYEETAPVLSRLANNLAAYADYAEQYRDQCGAAR